MNHKAKYVRRCNDFHFLPKNFCEKSFEVSQTGSKITQATMPTCSKRRRDGGNALLASWNFSTNERSERFPTGISSNAILGNVVLKLMCNNAVMNIRIPSCLRYGVSKVAIIVKDRWLRCKRVIIPGNNVSTNKNNEIVPSLPLINLARG